MPHSVVGLQIRSIKIITNASLCQDQTNINEKRYPLRPRTEPIEVEFALPEMCKYFQNLRKHAIINLLLCELCINICEISETFVIT